MEFINNLLSKLSKKKVKDNQEGIESDEIIEDEEEIDDTDSFENDNDFNHEEDDEDNINDESNVIDNQSKKKKPIKKEIIYIFIVITILGVVGMLFLNGTFDSLLKSQKSNTFTPNKQINKTSLNTNNILDDIDIDDIEDEEIDTKIIDKNEKKIDNKIDNKKIVNQNNNTLNIDSQKSKEDLIITKPQHSNNDILQINNGNLEKSKINNNFNHSIKSQDEIIQSALNNDPILQDMMKKLNQPIDLKNLDVYTLNDEKLTEIKNQKEYLKRQNELMTMISNHLKTKEEFKKTIDQFNNLTSVQKEQPISKEMKKTIDQFNNKIELLQRKIDNQTREISVLKKENNNFNKKTNNINTNLNNNNSLSKNNINNNNINVIKNNVKENINNLFKNVQIFSMNNELIAVISQNDSDLIFKEGDMFDNGFIITNINENIITFKKDNDIIYHNIKQNFQLDTEYNPVIIELSNMKDNNNLYNEKTTTNNNNNNNNVQQYLSPNERKQEVAKQFFSR